MLFCQSDDMKDLHNSQTLHLGKRVHKMATELEDSELLARVEGGDFPAMEVKYHKRCVNKQQSVCVSSFCSKKRDRSEYSQSARGTSVDTTYKLPQGAAYKW